MIINNLGSIQFTSIQSQIYLFTFNLDNPWVLKLSKIEFNFPIDFDGCIVHSKMIAMTISILIN